MIAANNALRASGLAWAAELATANTETSDEDSNEDSDEDSEEEESHVNTAPSPPLIISENNTHVWVVRSANGGAYIDTGSAVTGVFRHLTGASQKTSLLTGGTAGQGEAGHQTTSARRSYQDSGAFHPILWRQSNHREP